MARFQPLASRARAGHGRLLGHHVTSARPRGWHLVGVWGDNRDLVSDTPLTYKDVTSVNSTVRPLLRETCGEEGAAAPAEAQDPPAPGLRGPSAAFLPGTDAHAGTGRASHLCPAGGARPRRQASGSPAAWGGSWRSRGAPLRCTRFRGASAHSSGGSADFCSSSRPSSRESSRWKQPPGCPAWASRGVSGLTAGGGCGGQKGGPWFGERRGARGTHFISWK